MSEELESHIVRFVKTLRLTELITEEKEKHILKYIETHFTNPILFSTKLMAQLTCCNGVFLRLEKQIKIKTEQYNTTLKDLVLFEEDAEITMNVFMKENKNTKHDIFTFLHTINKKCAVVLFGKPAQTNNTADMEKDMKDIMEMVPSFSGEVTKDIQDGNINPFDLLQNPSRMKELAEKLQSSLQKDNVDMDKLMEKSMSTLTKMLSGAGGGGSNPFEAMFKSTK